MTSSSIVTVEFHGQSLVTTQHNGEPHVAMRPIVEAMGLDWQAQLQRIKRHPVLAQGVVMITTPSDGGTQEANCLPLKLLNGWLFGIDTNRVKPELRETILMYQRECYDALYRYWHEGSAANPRFRPEKTRKALPGGLTVEQQDAIKALVKSRVEILPQGAQAKAAITCWSAVKSKFGVSYKEVPATNFPDVLSLVARLPLDGELLKAPKGKYHFPLEFWQPTNRIGRSGWITWTELTRIESADLPLSNLLSRLAADGHDVEGARVEYRAMRLLLESMHWTIADIAARVNAIPRRGLSVAF